MAACLQHLRSTCITDNRRRHPHNSTAHILQAPKALARSSIYRMRISNSMINTAKTLINTRTMPNTAEHHHRTIPTGIISIFSSILSSSGSAKGRRHRRCWRQEVITEKPIRAPSSYVTSSSSSSRHRGMRTSTSKRPRTVQIFRIVPKSEHNALLRRRLRGSSRSSLRRSRVLRLQCRR